MDGIFLLIHWGKRSDDRPWSRPKGKTTAATNLKAVWCLGKQITCIFWETLVIGMCPFSNFVCWCCRSNPCKPKLLRSRALHSSPGREISSNSRCDCFQCGHYNAKEFISWWTWNSSSKQLQERILAPLGRNCDPIMGITRGIVRDSQIVSHLDFFRSSTPKPQNDNWDLLVNLQ